MLGARVEPRPEDARKSRRINVRFKAEFSGRRVHGAGIVENISLGGALLDQCDPLLLSGGELRVRFSLFEDSLPLEVPAEIVRETKSGFAVRFVAVNRRMKGLLRVALSRAATLEPPRQSALSSGLLD